MRKGGGEWRGGLSRINEVATEELAERIHRKARESRWPVNEQSHPLTQVVRGGVDEDVSRLPYLSSSTSIAESIFFPLKHSHDSPPPPSYPLPPLPLFAHTTTRSHHFSSPLKKSPNLKNPISSIYAYEPRSVALNDELETTLDSIEHAIEKEFGMSSPPLPVPGSTNGEATRRGDGPPTPLKDLRIALDIVSTPGSQSIPPTTKNSSLLSRFRSHNALATLSRSQHNLLALSHLGNDPSKKSSTDSDARSGGEMGRGDPFLVTPRGLKEEGVQYRIPSIIHTGGLNFDKLSFDYIDPSSLLPAQPPVAIQYQQKSPRKETEDYFGNYAKFGLTTTSPAAAGGKENLERGSPVSRRYSDAAEYDIPSIAR